MDRVECMDGFRRRILRRLRSPRWLEGRIDGPATSQTVVLRPQGYRTHSLKRFFHGQRGSAAVEGAIAISILVAAFAGLMAIVQESYATDRLGRAARAAARAVALNSQADPCAAIRRELDLAADFDCEGQWQITVDHDLSPSNLSTLLAGDPGDGNASGELILVRIGWKQGVSEGDTDSEPEIDTVDGEGVPGSDPEITDPIDTEAELEPVPMVAMGVARSEPEAG